jgi:hypothetical protein
MLSQRQVPHRQVYAPDQVNQVISGQRSMPEQDDPWLCARISDQR